MQHKVQKVFLPEERLGNMTLIDKEWLEPRIESLASRGWQARALLVPERAPLASTYVRLASILSRKPPTSPTRMVRARHGHVISVKNWWDN
eukprot:1764556-Pyramimonas_sp.AAC.1